MSTELLLSAHFQGYVLSKMEHDKSSGDVKDQHSVVVHMPVKISTNFEEELGKTKKRILKSISFPVPFVDLNCWYRTKHVIST